jgi:hypothetical protein
MFTITCCWQTSTVSYVTLYEAYEPNYVYDDMLLADQHVPWQICIVSYVTLYEAYGLCLQSHVVGRAAR